MIHFFHKAGVFAARSVLALAALLFVALISIQIILVIGINFVSAGWGTNFFADRINHALADSGYQTTFSALYYDPVRGITVRDLSVSDTEGVFLTLDKLSIDPSFSRSAMKTLGLSIQGGHLMLARMPVSTNEETPDASEPQPFETPDIYFHTISLSRLAFDHVTLGPAIAGTQYIFSPSLNGRIKLDDGIDVALMLAPGMPELAPGLAAPDTVNIAGRLTPETLDVTLKQLRVSSLAYTVDAQGTGNLSGPGQIALTIDARHDDLSVITGDAILRASAQAALNGPLSGPALDINAAIIPGTLKERGLSDIAVTVKTADISEGMQGQAHIETIFQEQPVTVDAALSFDAPMLHIADIKGTAPSLTLGGGGALDTGTSLFDGTLTLSVADLAPYGELAGIILSGAADISLSLSRSDTQQQSASVNAVISNGVYDTIKVQKLSLQAALQSIASPWPQSANMDAAALRIGDDITLDTFRAAIEDAEDGQYKFSVNGKGRTPVALSFDGSAMMSGLTDPVPTARDIALTVTQNRSSVRLSGDFSPDTVNLTLSAPEIRGKDIPADLPPALNDVRFALNATMTGTPAQPRSDATLTLDNLSAGEYRNARATISAVHDGQTVTATLSGQGTGLRQLSANATFPMTLSLLPFQFTMDRAAPLSGSMAADIDMAAIAPLFLPPSQLLSGALIADGSLSGTLSNPAPTATLRISGATFEDDANGITLSDINVAASATHENLNVTSLSATDGKDGTLSGSGALSFNDGGTDIGLRIQNLNIPRTDLANGIIDADLSLKGSADGLALSGLTTIAQMDVLIPETFQSRIPQLNIVEDAEETGPSFLDRLALDITIEADNRLFVRGWGLDAEFGGTIAVTGTGSAPLFNGTMETRRGRFEEFGKRFTLARAHLRFQGEMPPSPYLDIEATTPAGDVTGAILFTGPVSAPSIKFSSTPALPEDEVLSRILFGKDSARISPFQAVQLAQTIARFSGQGGGSGLDPLGMLREATGLDDISVEMDESGQANVDVGKYLTDNVYLELSKGKGADSGEATIQIELTPSINIQSSVGQDAQGGGGIFWKRDY